MFETIFAILTRLETSADATWYTEGTHFDITLEDFDGFDANFCEIDRPYADPEMVEALFEVLVTAKTIEGSFSRVYRFADCSATVRYASDDI